MANMDILSIVQDCIDDGVVLTTFDDNKISIKGNKKAPALATLRSLVTQDRAAVLTAIMTTTAKAAGFGQPAQPELLTQPAETVSKVDTAAPGQHLDARTAPPEAFLGRVISQTDMDVLLERGRAEGFGMQGQWQSEEYPCDWRVVRVWDLAAGYEAGVAHQNAPKGTKRNQ